MPTLKIDYTPRAFQEEIHNDAARFLVLLIHRRAGKTVLALNHLIQHALWVATVHPERKRPRLAYIAPLKTQAKRIAWDYLLEFTEPFKDRIVRQTELAVDLPSLNNARIYLIGADDPDSLRGIYLDGCVLDELDQMNFRVFTEVIRPALSDRKGICVFAGTPKGRGNLFNLYMNVALANPKTWARFLYTVEDTGLIDAHELEQIKAEIPEDEFQQEYMCSFDAAIKGAYYSKQMNEYRHQHKPFAYDPSLPVYSVWDLGITDSTAIIIFQTMATGAKLPEVRVLDYYENSSEPLQHYVGHLFSLGLPFVCHYLPHDVRVCSLSTGVTRLQTLRSMGLNNIRIVANHRIPEGINSVRNVLPSMWFNTTDDDPSRAQKRVMALIEHLRQYRARTDQKNPELLKPTPVHDDHSHGADAARYLAMSTAMRTHDNAEMRPQQAYGTGYDPLSQEHTTADDRRYQGNPRSNRNSNPDNYNPLDG